MRKTKASDVSTERRNWEKIFNGMVQMLRAHQQQLLSLVNDRKLLEDRIRMLHDRWASDIRLYKDQISKVKGILMFEEKRRLLEGAKADLLLGFKQREASILNYILEHKEDELGDFKAWFEFLSQKSSDGEDQVKICENTKKRKKGTTDSGNKSIRKMAEKEKSSSKLAGEYEVALGKNSEVSALVAEKNFVWNQYKIMENEYINKLRSKDCEVEEANAKIEKLVSRMEQLQSANDEKDETISRLESKLGYMEADTKRLNEKLSKLSEELELLRKSRNAQVTPVLNCCAAGTKSSGLGYNGSSRRSILKKELSVPKATGPAKNSEKENRSLKRKESPCVPVFETPKLFSSNFKVPKLKNRSPSVS